MADNPVHISVVLDRSGSMASVAEDIVGGFNEFLADQRQVAGSAAVTLVQFDSHDPFELVIDAVDLREVCDLDRSAYQPRGLTPLYDAVGRMIGRIDTRIASRREHDLPVEDQVVLIITDGLENASREHTRDTVFAMIEERRNAGWVFVFLGANQDAYAAGEEIAVARGNRAAWVASKEGSKEMWKNLSHSAREHRSKASWERHAAADEFYKEEPDQN